MKLNIAGKVKNTCYYNITDNICPCNDLGCASIKFYSLLNFFVMKSKTLFRFCFLVVFAVFLNYGCNELEYEESQNSPLQELNLSSRSQLSKALSDSTLIAESEIVNNFDQIESNSIQQNSITSLVNHALQATVSAESTFPGYSVEKIKDGSRNTTVGPSYSWANNYPAGGRLPESVFLKFSSSKVHSQIDIYTSSGYPLKDYTILYRSTAAGAWINLLSVVGNTATYRTHSFADISAIEVQVRCELGPSNQYIYGRLNEVELYGPDGPTLPPISVQNGMLVFNSEADVEQAMEYLEYKYEQYSYAFVSQYAHLTDDQLADVEESTGFNDHQPYINFENQFGYSSLRAQIKAAEDIWLATTAGDETAGPDPDDSYMMEDELRTLVNANGEIKVGSTYYIFLSDGSYYTSEGSTLTLKDLNDYKSGGELPETVMFHAEEDVTYNSVYVVPPLPDCKLCKKNRGFRESGSWRFKWKVKACIGPFGAFGKAKAITKSYKKKNGRWKVRSATIGALVYGELTNWVCYPGPTIDSQYKQKRIRKVKAKVNYVSAKVASGGIKSYHYHNKVGSYSHTLTW